MTDLLQKYLVGETEVTGSTIRCYYRFTSDFLGFSGHFPGYPILPAFVQTLVGIDLVSRLKGGKQVLAAIENAKFRVEIHPGDNIAAECIVRPAGSEPRYEVRLSVEGRLASSFSVVVQTGEEGETC